MKLPESAIEFLLDNWPVARLASTGPDGRPHQVPIVFAREGARLFSPVDGKPKSGRELARVRNVRRRPEVSLLLDHYDADWQRLWWLRLEGTARVIRPATASAWPEFDAVVASLRAKYPQYRRTPLLGDPPTLLAIEPTAVGSWCAGPEAVPQPPAL